MVRSGRGRSFRQKLVTLLIELSVLLALLAVVAPHYLKNAFQLISAFANYLP